MSDKNFCGWFEIAVTDMERAIAFYEQVFKCNLDRNQMGELDMAWFPYVGEGTGAGGSLVCHKEFYHPSAQGTLVYLSSRGDDLADELLRVEPAGGKVLVAKREIAPGYGHMAVIVDTEGNRIALHSRN